ncbi:hypothetical protein Daus18300_009393 [Diaporthe australafricana]|uniref:Elongation factor 1-alpha n=1 Tax=Diaporthe australafricana TaxID=127596 RepID=A0ABR3WF33_9PEZI
MSRHRLYQNYDYQNDLEEFDGDEEEEEEELSAEDKAQMTAATAEVKSMLGPQASKVTTQQIQESLWHYYYDIDKTVAYLVTKFVDPAPKPAAKSKASKATPQVSDGVSEADSWRACATNTRPRPSCASFFADMPWLHVPEEGRTVFIKPPRVRGGGLLGGSSGAPKMSKLQALAAARKKKREEQKAEPLQNKHSEVDILWKTSIPSPSSPLPHCKDSSSFPSPVPQSTSSDFASTLDGSTQDFAPAVEKAPPSAFAQALFKSASETPQPFQQLYAPPWLAFTTDEALKEAFTMPSPDDVVQAAQSQAGKRLTSNAPSVKTDAAEAARQLKELKIAETPLPKSKHLNVLSEFEKSKQKRSASFVIVGHVDSGKSTMTARLLLDLGEIDQRTVDKCRKEAEKEGKSSFALAWVLDTGSDERARGVTMDIATRNFETESTLFTMIDSPGHRDYVRHMIAGASQADFGVLVVDAAKGAFEAGLKGLMEEHVRLLRSMGVFRLIVAVNKLDTSQWNQDRFDEIKNHVTGSLKALKFPDKLISFVPVSGLNGDNIVKSSKDPAASWYTGPTLIEELESSEPAARLLDKPLRMTILDRWDTPLSRVAAAGRLDAGSLQVGDALLVQPGDQKAYVKALERNGEHVDWAVAGQYVVIYLSHVDEENIFIGNVICSPRDPVRCVNDFIMKALAFDIFFPMPVDIHRGSMNAPGTINELRGRLDIHTGAIIKKKPQTIRPGEVARIRMKTTEKKVPLEVGDRMVIMHEGMTVAAGLVEQTL